MASSNGGPAKRQNAVNFDWARYDNDLQARRRGVTAGRRRRGLRPRTGCV